MAKASVPLMKDEFKRRAVTVDRDDTEGMSRLVNVVGISPKAARNPGCVFFSTVAGIVLMAVAGLIAAVLT